MNKALLVHIISENRRLLILAASLLSLLIVLFFISAAMGKKVSGLRFKWDEKNRAISLQNPTDAVTLYRQRADELNILKGRMPVRYDLPVIIGQLTDLASSQKLAIGSINYKQAKSQLPAHVSYIISSSVNGDYASLKRFLAKLQGMDGLSTVNSFMLYNNDPFEVNAGMDFEITVHLREGGR